MADDPAELYAYYGNDLYADGRLYGGSNSIFGFDPGVLMDNGKIWLYAGFTAK